MISTDDFCWYVDRAVDQMVEIVVSLGDERANRRPDLPEANSAYAILTHCLGVMAWWGGHIVGGREMERDRAAEFVATGSVVEIAQRAQQAKDRFVADVVEAAVEEAPRIAVAPQDAVLPLGRTQGGALLHIYEELSQHLGQMELTRDIIRETS